MQHYYMHSLTLKSFFASTRGSKGKASTSSTLASILQPSGGTRAGAPAPRLYPHKLCLGLAYFFVHWSTQSFTVSYQRREFCGFSTQWPSSGKYSIFDGTPSICSVVKSWKPSLTSRRKSRWPWITSVGVLKFFAYWCGDHFWYMARLS